MYRFISKQIKNKNIKILKGIPFKNTQSFVNIKTIVFSIFCITLLFTSCVKEDDVQEIPAYIKVTDFNLTTTSQQGENTENITDVWAYVDDQFMGTYPLPVSFPILQEGNHTLKLFAGIKDNGIEGTRVRYHFYKFYEEVIFLTKDSITTVFPTFRYTESANFEIEDFEGVGVDIDTSLNSEVDFEIKTEGNGNKYASAILDGNYLTFELVTKDFENLPQSGSPVYLEIDYKCNQNILIGAFINYPQTVVNKDLLWVTEKEDWHKIYINMTKTVSEAIGNQSIKFYLNLHRTDTTESSWLKIDNLKLVY